MKWRWTAMAENNRRLGAEVCTHRWRWNPVSGTRAVAGRWRGGGRWRTDGAMAIWKTHFVLDVEADGPCPGLYNLISFGLVSVADPAQGFLGEVAPILGAPGIADARQVSGVSFEVQRGWRDPEEVMRAAIDWLGGHTQGKRPILWSDNPAFDWQFWNWYCHKYIGQNPAGFSMRRIGDLDAGRRGEPLNSSAWKKRRETDHTHNPLDDARGNAEALRWILRQMGVTL